MRDLFNKTVHGINNTGLVIWTAVFLVVFTNITFFSNLTGVYPFGIKNILFLGSLLLFSIGLLVLILAPFCFRFTIKPVLITILLVSSLTAYFMDAYNVIIDDSMINNIAHTDLNESMDLFSIKLVLYFILLGVAPSFFVYRVNIEGGTFWKEFLSRVKLVVVVVLVMMLLVYAQSDYYSSFFREHKQLRYYANPTHFIYSIGKYAANHTKTGARVLNTIGLDAKIPETDKHRELIIFVIGETARADRFSLNGYEKETTPLLEKESVFSFNNFWSCGTTTAYSVPCMFSIYGSDEFSEEKGATSENVLDVLKRAGVNVVWLDNNSDSKGVADRVEYQSYKSPVVNHDCLPECHDEGMLENLQTYINEHPQGDIFIVLHQLGNHGPAYYKRYPAEFQKFTPVCKTNQLEECTKEEIDNAYDNAILYTDHFLAKVIELLKKNEKGFESAMFYVSDHGESLGEGGFYLHGLPNFIAPDEQKHVPAVLWLSKNFDDVDREKLAAGHNQKYTHDNLFHTILGFMEVETSIYDKSLDILYGSKQD